MEKSRERQREDPILSSRREWYSSFGSIALMVGIYFIAPLGMDDDPLPLALAAGLVVGAVLVMAFLIGGQVRRTFVDSTSVKLARLALLLSVTILAFAAGYFILQRSSPGQMVGLETRLDSLYFTLVTLGTIGYGDIHPAGQVARGISCLQIVFNAVYIGALVRVILFQVNARARERGVAKS
jgi:voltage-gated potassium channel